MMGAFSALPVLLGAIGLVSAATKSVTLNVASANVSPDGFSRPAVTINGALGGPLIAVNKNDRIEATVNNDITSTALRQSTTVHWHGMFQHRTSTEDGVAFVTQCPISPGLSYTYNFSTAGQTGTYWYHSHHTTQYCDGLRGPLVVYDPQDPLAHLYDVDNASTVITLGDWYHLPAMQAFADPTIIAPTYDSILFNNKGHYAGGPDVPQTVFEVVKGLRYRFRLINVSCFSNMNVTLDGHNFTVIEADGIEHEPLTVDSLRIYPGQRYSIVIDANQAVGNYWFRATPAPPVNNATISTDPGLNAAIFRYAGAPATNPTTTEGPSVAPLAQANLVPLINPGPPGGSGPADVAINLVIALNVPNWTINGASFIPTPSVPVLLQILSGANTAQELLPAGDVYVLPPNKTIELTLPDSVALDPTLAHPFHLHGHTFDVIRGGGETVSNFVNPPRRDVLPVFDGNTTIRFSTNNPGPWIFHCHIDWHLNQGLAVVFAEDPDDIKSGPNSVIVPPAYDNLCPTYNALPPSQQ